MNLEDIKAVIAKLKPRPRIDCLYHDGRVYKKTNIYKGWLCTGHKWVIDG